MKKIISASSIAGMIGLLAFPVAATAATAAAGKSCAKVGATSNGLTCTQTGAKKLWSKTAPTTAAAVATTAAPAATSAPATTSAPAKAATAKAPTKLVFAPVPAENAIKQAADWAPFVKAVSDKIGVPIEQVSSTDYAGVTEGVLAGKVDIAMYGPLSYYIAKEAGAKLRGVAITAPSFGQPGTYQSFLFTKAGRSDINSIADIKGKKVCFGDPESTSGTLFPYLMLADAGIDSQKDITNVVAGAHDKAILGVVNGSCDAGFAFDTIVLSPSGAAAKVAASELKIVQKSKPIPNSPIAVRSDLPADLMKKLTAAIVDVDSLYLQANGYCPSSAPKCGPGSVGPANVSWQMQPNDDWLNPISAACKLNGAPKSCRPAK